MLTVSAWGMLESEDSCRVRSPVKYKLHACHYRLVKPLWSIAGGACGLFEHTFTYTRAENTTYSDHYLGWTQPVVIT